MTETIISIISIIMLVGLFALTCTGIHMLMEEYFTYGKDKSEEGGHDEES